MYENILMDNDEYVLSDLINCIQQAQGEIKKEMEKMKEKRKQFIHPELKIERIAKYCQKLHDELQNTNQQCSQSRSELQNLIQQCAFLDKRLNEYNETIELFKHEYDELQCKNTEIKKAIAETETNAKDYLAEEISKMYDHLLAESNKIELQLEQIDNLGSNLENQEST
ncbi:unnamed protein product [Thelazia callipaeda]|uniref:ING domain-containing protein n=1 Tax=Thelazia callipaeda TaxID=103827 RepID=A0A0N5CU98_THECL|nr:unnamed protein product [Thelazia callipaeda]